MPIIFDPLWETMKQKNISTYALIKQGFSKGTLDRLKHNRPVTTDTIEKLCKLVDCSPNDIMKYVE